MRHVVRLGIAFGLLGFAAQAAADDTSIAEQLFREGKRLLASGQVAQACKAFEGSYRKDAAITTLLNLADCREKNGQYASAWGLFLEVERLSRGRSDASAYRATAAERAAKLEAKLSFLTINVPPDSSREGLQIRRNGFVVDNAEWNTPIPVDGGEYVIVAEAPAHERWSVHVPIGQEGDKKTVAVPALNRIVTTDPPGAANSVEPAENRRAGRGIVAPTLLAAGGLSVLTGLTAGYLARSKWSEAEAVCGQDHFCDTSADRMEADQLGEAARLRANVANVALGIGIVAVGAGTYLWVRGARRHSQPGLSVDVRSGSRGAVVVGLGGSF